MAKLGTPSNPHARKIPPSIPNTNEISGFIHCGMCLREVPKGTSPREYAQLEVGWTGLGLQIWCRRHEANVMHIDFEEHRHPANTTAAVDQPAKH